MLQDFVALGQCFFLMALTLSSFGTSFYILKRAPPFAFYFVVHTAINKLVLIGAPVAILAPIGAFLCYKLIDARFQMVGGVLAGFVGIGIGIYIEQRAAV